MADFKPLTLFLVAIALALYLPLSFSEAARLELQGFFAPATRFVVHSQLKTAAVFSALEELVWPMEASQRDRLLKANTSMHDRLFTLSDQVASLQRQVREQSQEEISSRSFTPIAATVLGRNYQNFLDELTIDVGSDDGLEVGMGVVQGSKVLGRVKAVSSDTATVAILVHSSCRIATRIKRNQKQGLLEGGQVTGMSVLCSMKYLFDGGKPGEEVAVKMGDLVLTSGVDPVFPAGLLVGEVTSVAAPTTDMFYDVKVKPAVDLSAIYSVVVLKPL